MTGGYNHSNSSNSSGSSSVGPSSSSGNLSANSHTAPPPGPPAPRIVRVAVVGQADTGKTSLISTAAHDTFDVRPPPVLPPTRLPPDYTPDLTAMLLTDTSSRAEEQNVTNQVIANANAVVVCFDPKRPATLDAVRSHWYPRIQRLNPDVPVILACTKADKINAQQDLEGLKERVEQAVYNLPNVECCLNCSAKTLRMVSDVFYYALKAVLYPLQPLYDRIEKQMKPLCIKAFKRVFKMCDADMDNALNDRELNRFQLLCFGLALTDEELRNIKQVVKGKMPHGVSEAGLDFQGFLFLHVLFIERGRLETVWTVLRRFGYGNDLRLTDELLDRLPTATLPADVVLELSPTAEAFLREQFVLHDPDNDGRMGTGDIQSLFSTVPDGLPVEWKAESVSRLLTEGAANNSSIPWESFLLRWRFAALTNPRTALANLLYLGFDGPGGVNPTALFERRPRRRSDKRCDLSSRTTLHCMVVGPSGCGKSSLLRALASGGSAAGVRGSSSATSLAAATALLQPGPRHAVGRVSHSGGGFGSSGSFGAGGHGGFGGMDGRADGGSSGGLGSGFSGGAAAASPFGTGGVDKALILTEVAEDEVTQLISAAALSGGTLTNPSTRQQKQLQRKQRAAASSAAAAQTADKGVAGGSSNAGSVHGSSGTGLASFGNGMLSFFDVAAVLFDASSDESYQRAYELLIALASLPGSDGLPFVLVAAKEDLGMSKELEARVLSACTSLRLPPPICIAAEPGHLSNLFPALAAAAAAPEGHIPHTPARQARARFRRRMYIGCSVAAATAAVSYVGWRLYSGHLQRLEEAAGEPGGVGGARVASYRSGFGFGSGSGRNWREWSVPGLSPSGWFGGSSGADAAVSSSVTGDGGGGSSQAYGNVSSTPVQVSVPGGGGLGMDTVVAAALAAGAPGSAAGAGWGGMKWTRQ